VSGGRLRVQLAQFGHTLLNQATAKPAGAVPKIMQNAGWPAPLYRAMSGNGGLLVYLIDLPNVDNSTQLISNCLASLAHSFETESVSVDQTVSNAARLTKIRGTVAAKGDHASEIGRVWRVSHADFYSDAEPVAREQLEALAALWPALADAGPTIFADVSDVSDGGGQAWTVGEVLQRNGIGYSPLARSSWRASGRRRPSGWLACWA
jgi:hypothetical protein